VSVQPVALHFLFQKLLVAELLVKVKKQYKVISAKLYEINKSIL